MKPRVLLTRPLPPPVMKRLRDLFRLTVNPADRPYPKGELLRAVKGKQGLISMLSDSVDGEVLRAGGDLRIIANYAVGYNNIDLKSAASRKIWVTHTPGVLTEATADLTWALILGLSRRIIEGDALVRSGQWSGWAPTQLLGVELAGKTLGIIGMGRIGRAVARRAGGYGMTILYHSRQRLSPSEEKQTGWTYASLPRILGRADLLTLHLPLTPATRHLIGPEAFRQMKAGAFLINTSRGPVVDEGALVRALKRGMLGGAGLDVFEEEPRVHPGLLRLPNVLLLPHLGSATRETRAEMGFMVTKNLQAVFRGEAPPNPVPA